MTWPSIWNPSPPSLSESFTYDGMISLQDSFDVTLDGVPRSLPEYSCYGLYRLLSVFPPTMKCLSFHESYWTFAGLHVAALFLRRFSLLEEFRYRRITLDRDSEHQEVADVADMIRGFLSWGGPPAAALGINLHSLDCKDLNIYLQLRHVPSLRTLQVEEDAFRHYLYPQTVFPSSLEVLQLEIADGWELVHLVEIVADLPHLKKLTLRRTEQDEEDDPYEGDLHPSHFAQALLLLTSMKSLERFYFHIHDLWTDSDWDEVFIQVQDAFQGREEELRRLAGIVRVDRRRLSVRLARSERIYRQRQAEEDYAKEGGRKTREDQQRDRIR